MQQFLDKLKYHVRGVNRAVYRKYDNRFMVKFTNVRNVEMVFFRTDASLLVDGYRKLSELSASELSKITVSMLDDAKRHLDDEPTVLVGMFVK